MPSKGRTLPATTPASAPIASPLADATTNRLARTGPETPAAGAVIFDMGELARALRRGPEVDRFNELSRRQDSLTAAESDELYRYRLRRLLARARRLDQLAGTEDETTLRQTLDDFRSRLEELRHFESLRREAGLPGRWEVDHSAEERALARLSALAARRPRGLIAGSDDAPDQPTGGVRVRPLAFAPLPDDVPVWILAATSIPSDALARHVEAIAAQGARVRIVRELSEISADAPPGVVLNWGSTQSLPPEIVALNRSESVRVSADQVESLQRLRELAPRTVVNPADLALLGTDRVVAKRRHGSRGRGKVVIPAHGGLAERAEYDCYQEFIPERREYRVSVLSGRIVSAYRKRPPEGAAPDDLRPAWSFERLEVIPRAVAGLAKEAARRIGLDYAGVDVIDNLRTGRAYCLEANAAPGMSEDTLKSLYAHLQETLRAPIERAG